MSYKNAVDFMSKILDLPENYEDLHGMMCLKLKGTVVRINGDLEFVYDFSGTGVMIVDEEEDDTGTIPYQEIESFEMFLPLPGFYDKKGSDGKKIVTVWKRANVQYRLSYNSDLYTISSGGWKYIDWATHRYFHDDVFYDHPVKMGLSNYYIGQGIK